MGAWNPGPGATAGRDEFLAGNTGETADGGAGGDLLAGGDGADTLYGGADNDGLWGGHGNDFLYGGDGDDTIVTGARLGSFSFDSFSGGADLVDGGAGNDEAYISNANVVGALNYNGATGAITLNGAAYGSIVNVERVIFYAGSGNDVLTGAADAWNIFYGGDGADTLIGGDKQNELYGGAGADTMKGGAGWDTYYVDNVGDVVLDAPNLLNEYGFPLGIEDRVVSSVSYTLANNSNIEALALSGSANLNATASNQGTRLIGNSGDNILTGGVGRDTFEGGLGHDTLIGGAGDDAYYVSYLDEDTIVELAGGGSDTVRTSSSYFDLSTLQNVENIEYQAAFGSTSGFLAVGTAADNHIWGSTGNDYFYTYDGNDEVYGQGGVNVFVLGGGNDNAQSGGAEQCYFFGGDGADTLRGGSGVDVFNGEAGDDYMLGGDGGDYFYGGAGNDSANGDSGNDIFVMADGADTAVGGPGQDYFYMGAGDDVMYGYDGVDVMLGEAGNDTFDGGGGVDYLFLGPGGAGDNDTVIINQKSSGVAPSIYGFSPTGVQVVYGFEAGGVNDVVKFIAPTSPVGYGPTFTSFAQVQAAITDYTAQGGFCVLTVDSDTSIWFIGVQPSQLTAADFVFA